LTLDLLYAAVGLGNTFAHARAQTVRVEALVETVEKLVIY